MRTKTTAAVAERRGKGAREEEWPSSFEVRLLILNPGGRDSMAGVASIADEPDHGGDADDCGHGNAGHADEPLCVFRFSSSTSFLCVFSVVFCACVSFAFSL